jgi:hypothetical protein
MAALQKGPNVRKRQVRMDGLHNGTDRNLAAQTRSEVGRFSVLVAFAANTSPCRLGSHAMGYSGQASTLRVAVE